MLGSLIRLLTLISDNHGITDKARLAGTIASTLNLIQDRSVYYCSDYAIRFSSSATRNFGNTVLSLSSLRKFDDRPFIVCLVTPTRNYCLLANSTFLKKISHSSRDLRENNIRGSFNGSDIVREFAGVENEADNIERLYAIHADIGFEGNLARLVEATNNISPTGNKFLLTEKATTTILDAPKRAMRFVAAKECAVLNKDLDARVEKFKTEILLAALIENVNVRGRVIEYLIAGEDEALRQQLISSLKEGDRGLPQFATGNRLGDYHREFESYDTETDIKTKIMILNSNPKGYNLDKMLEFLAQDRSVFMFYFVGVDPRVVIKTALVSMFQKGLLRSTIELHHWAGRNSRGVTQFEGKTINDLITAPSTGIDEGEAVSFLNRIIAL